MLAIGLPIGLPNGLPIGLPIIALPIAYCLFSVSFRHCVIPTLCHSATVSFRHCVIPPLCHSKQPLREGS